MKNVLDIDRPTLMLGDKRLETNVKMSLGNGCLACITGDSGRGKTSLLRAILGFVPIVEGNINVLGKSVSNEHMHTIRRQVAYVPQELNPPVEWVSEMVALPFSLRANAHLNLDKKRLMALWYDVGLESGLYQRRVNELSGGQRARISITTAMLLSKQLLLIDEPTAALDEESSQRVSHALRRHAEHTGSTMLVVSHDPIIATTAHMTYKMQA